MKSTRVIAVVLSLALGAFTSYAAVTVTNVTARMRPNNFQYVDIAYDLLNPSNELHDVVVEVSTNAGAAYVVRNSTNMTGDIGLGVSTGVQKQVEWFSRYTGGDLPMMSTTFARVRVTATENDVYCIIDVSGGPNASSYPVSYQSTAPSTNDVVYKTTTIVLRRIPAGSFTMGSPTNELFRATGETNHYVTLTKAFYMGIYEITQAQYSNVMGVNPSTYTQGAHAPTRPVETVSWNTIRGGTWPGGIPDSTNFMGKLRAKTGLAFDLPTEAQWEYACRATTTGSWNNGTTITNTTSDGNLNILGRYYFNGGSTVDPVNGAHTTAGSYVVNQWGLYDMHGNVFELCLDWYGGDYENATDPIGAASGSNRMARGGSWGNQANNCRSARRFFIGPSTTNSTYGFRLSLPVGKK